MLKLLNYKQILTILCICYFHCAFSQVKESNKDSIDAVYNKVKNYSKKSKVTKLLYKFIGKSNKKSEYKSSTVQHQIYRTFEGKTIRNIKVKSHDPFKFSVKDSANKTNLWVQRTGNRLHIKSKEFAVKNFIIFKENTLLDSLKLIESERLIRSQKFIRSVKIIVKPVADSQDSVDVYITTLDSWSLGSVKK